MEESAQSEGFKNIDELPLGKLLQVKQDRGKPSRLGKHRRKKLNIHKLMEKGFK